ncbi:Fe/S biogenesis protein NfuA OS=Stutzerimonas stutzeri OX=316 GN=nfuA PE=3 SV=1 [Stutzerimonas stutzeri]
MSAITITEAAHDYLADLLEKQNTTGIGIRIFITQPGTPYAETCIAYCKPGQGEGPGAEELHCLDRDQRAVPGRCAGRLRDRPHGWAADRRGAKCQGADGQETAR